MTDKYTVRISPNTGKFLVVSLEDNVTVMWFPTLVQAEEAAAKMNQNPVY